MTTHKNKSSLSNGKNNQTQPQSTSPQIIVDTASMLPEKALQPSAKIKHKPKLTIFQGRSSSFIKWFSNLTLGHKQLIALIAAELISIVGLSIGARWMITTGLRTQLLDQAKSEVTVTESNINLKVNQTRLGFRSQSDNDAIIDAASTYAQNRTLPSGLQKQIQQILQNEIKARNIEYATLVGRDFKIIANAHANRKGETFNPNNLVREVFTNFKQIQANAIVNSAELSKEFPLPPGTDNQDLLIRYTLTPVRDSNTKEVIAVLVSGDVVNGKLPIMAGILKDFGGGYSGIYLRKPTGEFALATSLDQGRANNLEQAKPNVALSNTSLLAAAAAAPDGQIVTGRMNVGAQTYTMTAKAIPNFIIQEASGPVPVFSGQPVAILVRGTPEDTLNSLLRQSLWQEGVILLLAALVTGIWLSILRYTITKPIEQLGRTTQKFAEGDRKARSNIFSMDEVGQLAITFNKMADSIVRSEAALSEQARYQEAEAERTQLFSDITLRIRQSLNLEDILKTAVKEVRKVLKTNRVVIYRFNSDLSGTVVAESITPGWTQALGEKIDDPCFRERYLEEYKNGRIRAIDNIYQASLNDCLIKSFEHLEAKAVLIAPILKDNQLLGLLIAHHCSEPRVWQQAEIDLFAQLATQIRFALDQAILLEQVENARLLAEVVSQEQRQQKEALQSQIVELLGDVVEASKGDLTVRAKVTAGEIGTVADFFNAIIASLREIVLSVKKAADQVNISIGEDEGAMRQLADEALNQAEKITRTLDSVEQMTLSIQAVADSAHQAAEVARTASSTAEAGGVAMDRTVKSILSLRHTVAETADKVKSLGESSQQISKVVSLINQIALQTNVLAINASIEAARAGEEGRGFAVVAEEVGKLAAKSGAATKEIEQVVENIQRETSEVVRAMEIGTTQVIEGTNLVEDTKKSLEQILDVSRQIDQLVQSISVATVSQAQTSQAVAHLMKDIAEASERTSDSSGKVSNSLQQSVEVAQQLQASVGTFKVDTDTN